MIFFNGLRNFTIYPKKVGGGCGFSIFHFNSSDLPVLNKTQFSWFQVLPPKKILFLISCEYYYFTNLNWSPPSRRPLYSSRSNFICSLFFILFFKCSTSKILRCPFKLFMKFYNSDLWRQRCGFTINSI